VLSTECLLFYIECLVFDLCLVFTAKGFGSTSFHTKPQRSSTTFHTKPQRSSTSRPPVSVFLNEDLASKCLVAPPAIPRAVPEEPFSRDDGHHPLIVTDIPLHPDALVHVFYVYEPLDPPELKAVCNTERVGHL
jgi:hypothetical protein